MYLWIPTPCLNAFWHGQAKSIVVVGSAIHEPEVPLFNAYVFILTTVNCLDTKIAKHNTSVLLLFPVPMQVG